MRRSLVALALAGVLAFGCGRARAQSALSTDNRSQKITTGNTYQLVEAANNVRRMVQIENNNTNTDDCWVNDDGTVAASNTTSTNVTVHGTTMTAAQASIRLTPGNAYTRYYPYVPDGPIVVTCTSTGDSMYAGIH